MNMNGFSIYHIGKTKQEGKAQDKWESYVDTGDGDTTMTALEVLDVMKTLNKVCGNIGVMVKIRSLGQHGCLGVDDKLSKAYPIYRNRLSWSEDKKIMFIEGIDDEK
jgi:hypothetical protein